MKTLEEIKTIHAAQTLNDVEMNEINGGASECCKINFRCNSNCDKKPEETKPIGDKTETTDPGPYIGGPGGVSGSGSSLYFV